MAFFIGSFNPPTLAHLDIALSVHEMENKIIMVPVNSKSKCLIDFHNRLKMLLIYHRKYPFIEISDIMMNYSYFDYRILDLLKKKYHDNKVIIGSDLLGKLKYFDNYEYLLNNYYFYVITRGNNSLEIIKNNYDKYQNKFIVINKNVDISSTMARELIGKNINLENVLDKDIISYIRNNHLYF